MSGLDYARAKRYARARAALHSTPPDTDTMPCKSPVAFRGWRLTDGIEHPVTVTKIAPREKEMADAC